MFLAISQSNKQPPNVLDEVDELGANFQT